MADGREDRGTGAFGGITAVDVAKPKKREVPPSITLDCNMEHKSLNVGAKGTVAIVLGYFVGGGLLLAVLAVAGAVAWKIVK